MRILLSTITPFPSGTANAVHMVETSQGLVDAGHEVLVVRAQPGPGWPGGGEPPDMSTFTLDTLAAHEYRGQSLVNGVRLYRRARNAPPDLGFADDVRGGLALALAGIRVIVEIHTMQFFTTLLGRAALLRLIRRPELAGLVVISRALRDDLIAASGVDPALVSVLPEAARQRTDAELVTQAPAWLSDTMRQGALQVGYTGSLYGGRGVGLMTEVARRLPDVDVHLLGGPAKEAEALRARTDLPKNLIVHGLRALSDAEHMQTSMDVLLAPYERSVLTPGNVDTSRWMSPMKLFGYLAAGRAIVCSDIPVLREILKDEATALLVDPEYSGSWVAAVTRLRDDAELRARLGVQGRALHAQHYTWEQRTRGLLAIWLAEPH